MTKSTKRQTTEQLRAATAWEQQEQADIAWKQWEQEDKIKPEDRQKKYGTLARKLPAMIQLNGLGSTLAFLLSKAGKDKKDEHWLIYNHVSNWVMTFIEADEIDKSLVQETLQRNSNDKTLMQAVRQDSMSTYRRLTTEAIEYAIWLKRYVDAKEWGK